MRRRQHGGKKKGWYRSEPTKKTPRTQDPARGGQGTDPSEAPTRAGDYHYWRYYEAQKASKASRWWRHYPRKALDQILRAARAIFLTNSILAISSVAWGQAYDCDNQPLHWRFVQEWNYIQGIEELDLWHLDRIDQPILPLDELIDFAGDDGLGIDLYVVDTGINPFHSELYPRVRGGFTPFNDAFGWTDDHGHGTAVAALAAGDLLGVAPDANIYSVRVFKSGAGQTSDVIAGFNWIYERVSSRPDRIAVVNYSGGGGPQTILDRAVCDVISLGVPVVVAAGNFAITACAMSPGRVVQAVTVGAIDREDVLAPYSNRGPCVDLYAPGEFVTIPEEGGGFTIGRGTSFAAPIAAGGYLRGLLVVEERSGADIVFVGRVLFRSGHFETGDFSPWSDVVCRTEDPQKVREADYCEPRPM